MNGKIYQTIGVINIIEIKNWDEIKKSSRLVNAEFQSQGENREAKHLQRIQFRDKECQRCIEFFKKENNENNRLKTFSQVETSSEEKKEEDEVKPRKQGTREQNNQKELWQEKLRRMQKRRQH